MNTKQTLLITGIAAAVLIAAIALVIALKPGKKNTDETPVTPKASEVPDNEVVYTVKYTYELDESEYTGTAEISKPKDRLTWSVSDIPETEKPGLYVVSAEITFSNLPEWTITWKEKMHWFNGESVGEFTFFHDGAKVFDTEAGYRESHFTDLNGDGLQEFCDVQNETIMVYDFASQKRSDLLSDISSEKSLIYEWFEGTDDDVVLRRTWIKGNNGSYDFTQRGKLVIAGETLEFQEITNPTSTDSIEVIPSVRKPVECWFDCSKGDEETRRLIRPGKDVHGEKECVFVVDKGQFYYYFPTPSDWVLRRYTDSGIVRVCSARRFLNAYVTDLDGDSIREICMTFQYPMNLERNGAAALFVYGRREQKIDQKGYDLRFVEENGRLVVKRKPIGGTKEETLSLKKTEDELFELAAP